MWSSTRKGRKSGLVSRTPMPSSGGTTTAWPSEETGYSSLAPWRIPKNSAIGRVMATGWGHYQGGDGETCRGGPCGRPWQLDDLVPQLPHPPSGIAVPSVMKAGAGGMLREAGAELGDRE